jgi:hypothetical protein
MTTLSQQETLTQLLWVLAVLLEQVAHKPMEMQVVIATLLAVALQEVRAVAVVSLVVQEAQAHQILLEVREIIQHLLAIQLLHLLVAEVGQMTKLLVTAHKEHQA